MTTIPPEAVMAAAIAIERELLSGKDYSMAQDSDEALARAALEAAAPLLAEATLAPLVKRHAPIRDEQWGAFYCGTCWDKHGSRQVWPCHEMLAIGALVPAEDVPPPAAATREDRKLWTPTR